ncbi:MAG TPA: tetratricopeptide repeat protein [Bryobacteraceae bacterium]|nr:tetratricopeptide repeat protein [Bryobacteraceae bacterium]
MIRHLSLLLRLWYRPGAAMGEILDRGSLLFASIAALAAGFALRSAVAPVISFYMPLLILAVIYVPGLLLLGTLIAHTGSLATAFQRDYSPLLTCVAMAWSAAQVPVLLAAWFAPVALDAAASAAYLYLAVLIFFAVRTVFGAGNGASAAIVCLSWVPLAAAALLWGPISMVLRLLASPFFLLYVIYYLGAEFGRLGEGLRSGQNYRRMLEAAAINPHDGEAQYQLGLIHQQRRQYTEAIRRFEAAVAIDRTETDAHFQLGRIAREQGRMDEALARFETVLRQDEKHSSSEVHRELGAVNLALGRAAEAERELALYTARREYDPEGLYWYGEALERNGKADAARDAFARAVEAARTAPRYRRHIVAKWSRLAQRKLRRG